MLVDPLTKGLPLKFLKDYVVHILRGEFVNFKLIGSVMHVIIL